MTLRQNIRRALGAPCNYDFLAVHRVLMAEHAWPVARPAGARLLKMLGLFSEGRQFNSNDLANLFHVNVRTITRDIRLLRESLALPIVFDPVTNTYKKGAR